jgi:hypothetical protein
MPHDLRFFILRELARAYKPGDVDAALLNTYNLSCASRHWRDTFCRHQPLIYRALLQQTVHPAVYRAAVVADDIYSERVQPATPPTQCTMAYSEIPRHVEEARFGEKGAAFDSHLHPTLVRDIANKHLLFQETAVNVAYYALTKCNLWLQPDDHSRMPIRQSEMRRFERTLYYVDIFFNVQYMRKRVMPYSPEEHYKCPDWVVHDGLFCQMFTNVFSVIEIEQIRCVIIILMHLSAYGQSIPYTVSRMCAIPSVFAVLNAFFIGLNKVICEDIDAGLEIDTFIDTPDSEGGGRFVQQDHVELFKTLCLDDPDGEAALCEHIIDVTRHGLQPVPSSMRHYNFPHDQVVADGFSSIQDDKILSVTLALSELAHHRASAYEDTNSGPTNMWLFAHSNMSDQVIFQRSILSL